MDELILQLGDGTAITVPRSLASITTYVLLEQEAWFEKEMAVIATLDAGMTVIDIGANLGVYSLPMARRVGREGHVFAYEPASETRGFLEKSTARNGFDNLEIVAAALSNVQDEAHLGHGSSSELHKIGGSGGAGETVRVTTLDAEDRARNWPHIDFMKIDAEGEELRILEGGRNFFARHSPLVMFECNAGTQINHAIGEAFRAIGYGLFRSLNATGLLVAIEPGEAIDGYELNLFATKPDRAARLAGADRLVTRLDEKWTPDDGARAAALDVLNAQSFAAPFRAFFTSVRLDPVYRDALAGYAVWRASDRPATERYAALVFAFAAMRDLCRESPSLARLSTLVRIAFESGHHSACMEALNAMFELIRQGKGAMSEPFWPCNPRFDGVVPGANLADWFMVAVLEHQERCASHSSMFTPFVRDLDWLTAQPLASTEMHRRRVLQRLTLGERQPVPERLLKAAPDHRNAEVWRQGLVPNTLAS